MLLVPLSTIRSPLVVVGASASNAAVWVVCPVPPLAIATVPVTLAAVPVVFWFRVGKSAATAIVNAPVPVVDFKIPVVRALVPAE